MFLLLSLSPDHSLNFLSFLYDCFPGFYLFFSCERCLEVARICRKSGYSILQITNNCTQRKQSDGSEKFLLVLIGYHLVILPEITLNSCLLSDLKKKKNLNSQPHVCCTSVRLVFRWRWHKVTGSSVKSQVKRKLHVVWSLLSPWCCRAVLHQACR